MGWAGLALCTNMEDLSLNFERAKFPNCITLGQCIRGMTKLKHVWVNLCGEQIDNWDDYGQSIAVLENLESVWLWTENNTKLGKHGLNEWANGIGKCKSLRSVNLFRKGCNGDL